MATTAINQPFVFLQERIREIGSAIFFNLSNSILKLPTSIVTTLEVDDSGFVWFFIQKPRQSLREFETEFPVRLDFYKKGTSFFMQVSGKGWVVADPEELNELSSLPEQAKEAAMKGMVLVKVKIMKAEYFETRGVKGASFWKNAFNSFTAWFKTSNQFRPNTYYPAS